MHQSKFSIFDWKAHIDIMKHEVFSATNLQIYKFAGLGEQYRSTLQNKCTCLDDTQLTQYPCNRTDGHGLLQEIADRKLLRSGQGADVKVNLLAEFTTNDEAISTLLCQCHEVRIFSSFDKRLNLSPSLPPPIKPRGKEKRRGLVSLVPIQDGDR